MLFIAGDGAVVDEQFNTTDVSIVVKTDLVTAKYVKHYERANRRDDEDDIVSGTNMQGGA